MSCTALLLGMAACSSSPLPNIFMVLVDDYGWGDIGYHGAKLASGASLTPTLDALVGEGIELNRHYVHMMCTPTRSSLQSGRLPIHVTTDLCSQCDKSGAIPRNMTGIAAQLKKAGYATHQVGKWDAGMTTPHHTPQGRGYDTSLNYFGHANWMYTQGTWLGSYNNRSDIPAPTIIDFWNTDGPANTLNGTAYEEYIFRDRIFDILNSHNKSQPLFLQYDSKVAHYPLEAPPEWQEKFSDIEQVNRRVYWSMVSFLDDQMNAIVNKMKELDLWDNTLMVLSSDNGGYVKAEDGRCNTTSGTNGRNSTDWGHSAACFNGETGASNYPHRGGKYTNFEGGIRVNAFVSGGFVPELRRGLKLEDMMHVSDWYTTFCALAGVPAVDKWAEESGLPGIDGFNLWPLLSGENATSPRDTILVTKQLLVHKQWKYIAPNTLCSGNARGGPSYPNASTATDPIFAHTLRCPSTGCLFDLENDPQEFDEVSSQNPDVVKMMSELMAEQVKTIWTAPHGVDPQCQETAVSKYGGFFGPWKEI